jgi:hypothetical protein
MNATQTHLQVYADAGGFDVELPIAQEVPRGTLIRVVRTDNNAANVVRVYGPFFNNITDGSANYSDLTVGRRCAIFIKAGGGFGSTRWYIVQ